MTEEIKDILKRYDEIGALILEQKLDEYGDKIGNGVYIYKVKVRNTTGTVVEKFEKLVILN